MNYIEQLIEAREMKKKCFKYSKFYKFIKNYRFDKSQVMKLAWELVRKVGLNLQEAMKYAWKQAKSEMGMLKVHMLPSEKERYFGVKYSDYSKECSEVDRQNNWSLD